MESRLERYKKRKREKRIRLRNNFILLFIIFIFIVSLNVVDNSYRTLLCISDKRLFAYEYKGEDKVYSIHIFGDDYLIEQERIDKKFNEVKEKINKVVSQITDRF